jgi:hypothetical protein
LKKRIPVAPLVLTFSADGKVSGENPDNGSAKSTSGRAADAYSVERLDQPDNMPFIAQS